MFLNDLINPILFVGIYVIDVLELKNDKLSNLFPCSKINDFLFVLNLLITFFLVSFSFPFCFSKNKVGSCSFKTGKEKGSTEVLEKGI